MVSTLSRLLLTNCIFISSHSMLLKKIPSSKLGMSEPDPSWFGNPPNPKENKDWTNKNWLKSRFHFSFAEYSNPANQELGVLRVMNDDLVQPDRGFGSHPHRNAEICTYVIDGFLTHQDTIGTKETISRGSIQYMTAGTGIVHSEHNLDKETPLRFIQMWITPRANGLKPNYGSFSSDFDSRHNQWYHMVSDVRNTALASTCAASIQINQDCNIYVTEVDSNTTVTFDLKSGRQAYMLCLEGSVNVQSSIDHSDSKSILLERHDALEIFAQDSTITTTTESSAAHLLLVEMAFTGRGRSDIK